MKSRGRRAKDKRPDLGRIRYAVEPLAFSRLAVVGLSLILTATVCAQQNDAAPQKLNPYTGKAEAIAEGQELFKKFNCYACHGMAGGGGMGPNLTDETWQTGDGSDANLQMQIKEGKGAMPPFKSLLTDDQVWKLIAFVRSLYKGRPETIRW